VKDMLVKSNRQGGVIGTIWYDVTSIVPPKMKQKRWKHIYVFSFVL
jgi:hypothetical protein